jgi:hypothetical protein
VRGKTDEGATVWVIHQFDGMTTRGQLETLVSGVPQSATSPLVTIGSRITDAGRQHYLAGDRHALFVGDFDKDIACVAPTGDSMAKLTCKQIDDSGAVVIELP